MMSIHSRIGAFLIAVTLGIVGLLVVAGCESEPEVPIEEFAPPTNLSAINGIERVVLSWDASPDENHKDFMQYNIYRGKAPEMPSRRVGYVLGGPGRSFTDVVENGVLYYYIVRAQKTTGDVRVPSNEVSAAGREGAVDRTITEFAGDGDSGFDFSEGLPVSLSQSNQNRFDLTDIYLGTGANDDDPGSALALKSPELLAEHGSDAWLTVVSGIKAIGTEWNVNTTTDSGFGTQVTVEQIGTVYAIKTPSGNYAKMMIEDVTGDPGSRQITFVYAYQPTVGLIQF